MKWRTQSLAVRLTAKLLLGLALVLIATSIVLISLQQRFAEHCARLNGLALTEVIYGALHSTMLANERKQLQASVQMIARQAPNLKVRIYNKEGRISVASDPTELGRKVSPKAPSCVRCHRQKAGKATRPLARLKPGERVHTFKADGHSALGIIRPIENRPTCARAGCHGPVAKEPLLGVLDVSLLLTPAEQSKRATTVLMAISASAALGLLTLIVVWVVRRSVQRPIRQLSASLEQLGEGNYSTRYEHGNDANEFNQLGAALNHMARDLERANAELLQWNQTLEHRVEEKTAELKHAQEQMIRVERMASLGKLAAVVAHEINNPLASVVTYSKLLIRRVHKITQTIESSMARDGLEILEAIASESARCGEIVSNLLLFARRTGSRQEPTDANEAINKALFLIKHKMDLAQVTAERELADDLPRFVCDPGQLEQALLALCVNAVEAMNEGGKLTVRSRIDGEWIRIEISDEGVGMPEEVRSHIFEPFYTTKSEDEGKGLGLGLSVVYGIVQRNRGTIEVQSEVHRGTTFALRFPLTPPEGEPQPPVEETALERAVRETPPLPDADETS